MHYSHLRPSINVHHLHWIISEYEEGEGIQWGHIVCIRIWKCYVDLSSTAWKYGNDHIPRSGAFAGVVQSHLTVSDHGQGCQSRTDKSLPSQPLQSPWQVDWHCTSGRWALRAGSRAGSSSGIDWTHRYRQQQKLPVGSYDDWACISAQCREADVIAPPPGARRSEGLGDLADDHKCSEADREVRLRELHQVQISSKAIYSHDLPWHWASAAGALGHMRSTGNSHQRRSIYAALHRRCQEAF